MRAPPAEANDAASTAVKGIDENGEPIERVRFYVRGRWDESNMPRAAFDIEDEHPPLTMVDAGLEDPIWDRGKRGTGPFERVVIRAERGRP